MRTRRFWCVRFPHTVLTPILMLVIGSPTAADRPQVPREAVAGTTGQLHAVLINGGGRPQINFHSHLDHLRRLLEVLKATGVEPSRIAILSGDGADPAPDLATREGELPADFWLLPRNIGSRLRPPIEYVDSKIEGFALRPATQDALRKWFDVEGKGLVSGDTLLFYVTDHGEKNEDDPRDNTITLWGEELRVSELRDLLATLDPGVRVVLLMSQCYSGAFANAAVTTGGGPLPRGNVCGYFSATAERKAHGCYAEVSGKDATGHSHRVFDAIASKTRLPEVQREVLVSDSTPDVPHATSSFFLETLLTAAAKRGGHETEGLVDQFLDEALREPLAWEREIRLLDRVGRTFGITSPRSLAQLGAQVSGLSELRERLDTYADRWSRALADSRRANLAAFLAASPKWRERLDSKALAALRPSQRQRELAKLLPALRKFTDDDPERAARLRDLHEKAEEASAARYRADVRLAAVLRMRTLLMDLAGHHYLTRYAPLEERQALARLEVCEDLTLASPETFRTARPTEPFPSLSEEQQRLEAIAPSWLGLQYRPPRDAESKRNELPPGAVVASRVYPDSPAAEAGLQVGDIVLGPPGEFFRERHALREWVMRGEMGRPLPLRLLRDGEALGVSVVLTRYPLALPALAGPPQIGSVAPSLALEYLSGVTPPEPGQSQLLFFWATWCAPCKKALPEVLAFAKDRNLPIIAITDEHPEEVEEFFGEQPSAGLQFVASDRRRVHFQKYGVSGTPTFVLVDAQGTVRHHQTGYDVADGLRVEGWSWQE